MHTVTAKIHIAMSNFNNNSATIKINMYKGVINTCVGASSVHTKSVNTGFSTKLPL